MEWKIGMLNEASCLTAIFNGTDSSRSRMVAANTASGSHGMLLVFNHIDDASSSLTELIMLRNDRGRLRDGIDEKHLSKRKNGERCHLSSII